MELVDLPGGIIELSDARRGTTREVTVQPFRLGVAPTSVAAFVARHVLRGQADRAELPATAVTWLGAVTWCNSASEHDGFEPAYSIDGGTVTWNPAAEGYRLPTEAEWVFGAQGGAPGARYGELSRIAWTAKDGVSGPQPSGRKEANDYGLFDSLGNVWEWCWDRLDPARYGDYRVLKGGGWADPGWSCRLGVRRGNAPDAHVEDVGFRVARGALEVDDTGAAQGWSEAGDRRRASLNGPLPVGWTPLV